MAIKNAFWKSLIGENAQVLISGAVAYTAQASLAAFQANAAIGEMGVFDGDTNLLVSGGGAASTTEKLYVALKREVTDSNGKTTNLVETTVTFRIGEVNATRTAYSAQVKQVTTITFGGRSVIQDITYTNETAAPVTITYVVAGASTALSVVVTGTAIVVNTATSAGSAATSTATQIAAAIAASAPAAALVTATVTGTGATVQTAQALTTIAATPAIFAGGIYELDIMELTPAYQPFPTYDYQYVAKTGDTLDTVLTNLTAQYNNTVSKQNINRDLIVTAVYTAATNSIVLTAINFGVAFRVLPKFDLQPLATVTYTTGMHIGSGFAEQMQLLEDGGDIFKGVTTNYPLQGSNPADYGKPPTEVNTALGYNLYVFSGFGSEKSKTPHRKQYFWRTILVGVPSTGTTPEVQIKAIFGL